MASSNSHGVLSVPDYRSGTSTKSSIAFVLAPSSSRIDATRMYMGRSNTPCAPTAPCYARWQRWAEQPLAHAQCRRMLRA